MRSKVVYVLGAGFSAPLGLPVMSNFLTRSKDLFAERPTEYGHFSKVFDEIGRMAVAKNYLSVDLFNIEEILSILDMEDYASGDTRHRKAFSQYLADTVKAYTPRFESPAVRPTSPEDVLFAEDSTVRLYCRWVAGLFGVTIRTTSETWAMDQGDAPDPGGDFGIVSLNYDMVLESCLDLINQQFSPRRDFSFRTTPDGEGMPLAKIHGSVDPLTIVPPTWQKSASKDVKDAWRLAAALLTEANEIRILGFSFPQSDGYMKYLFSLGAMRAPHLKRIDVVCLDPSGDVERRYRDFFSFPAGFRFKSMDLRDYFSSYGGRTDEVEISDWHGHKQARFIGINEHHARRMA